MAYSKPPVHHIDRRELYTDLETRVRYLQSFLDFNADDVEALMNGAKYIKALIPALVNIVYKKLLQYDITARAFITRSTSYEGPIDEHPDEDSPQIQHRKMFLRGYLYKLCSDPSTMEFWEYLDKVGMMHVGRGRTHPLHIEYVHIGATLGMVQDVMTEAILGHPKLSIRRKTALIRALGKIIWMQNDLFAKWYVRDGEEYTRDMATPTPEDEGYLHGKRVLVDDEDGDEEEMDTGAKTPTKSAPSQCPFAHVSADMAGLSMQEAHAQAGISAEPPVEVHAKAHVEAPTVLDTPPATPTVQTDIPAPEKVAEATCPAPAPVSPTSAAPSTPPRRHLTKSPPMRSPRPETMSGIPRPVEKSMAST